MSGPSSETPSGTVPTAAGTTLPSSPEISVSSIVEAIPGLQNVGPNRSATSSSSLVPQGVPAPESSGPMFGTVGTEQDLTMDATSDTPAGQENPPGAPAKKPSAAPRRSTLDRTYSKRDLKPGTDPAPHSPSPGS